MKRLFWALAAALMMFAPAALAQTAQEITDTCTLSAVGKKTLGRMTDGQYQTYWASSSGSYAYVEIEDHGMTKLCHAYGGIRRRPVCAVL